MKLKMREQGRPVALPIGSAVNRDRQMSDIKKEHELETEENMRTNGAKLNIPVGKESDNVTDLTELLSRLSLPGKDDVTDKRRDLVGRLRALLARLAARRGVGQEGDLCPRGPDRIQHHAVRLDNYPYQNSSRKHHSGGSTVAYSNPIAPAPSAPFSLNNNHNHLHLNHQSCTVNSPPVTIETSNVPSDIGLNNGGDLGYLDETDMRLIKSLATEIFSMYCNESDLPASISEINSSQLAQLLDQVDRQVPASDPALVGPNDCYEEPRATRSDRKSGPEDSPSGYYSLSPTSVFSTSPSGSHDPFSPGSNYSLPDESNLVPDISCPARYSDVPFSTNYNLSVNIYSNDIHYDEGSSGYSSTSTPSPTVYKPSNFEHDPQDFETECQIASNAFENQSNDAISNLLPTTYEDSLESELQDLIASGERSQSNVSLQDFATTSLGAVAPEYTSNLHLGVSVTSPAYLSTATAAQFNGRPAVYVAQNNVRPDVASPNSNFSGATVTRDSLDMNLYCPPSFPSNADHLPVGFTSSAAYSAPAVSSATYSAPAVSNVQLGILVPVVHATLVTPVTSNLKRLEPKVEKPLGTKTGKERILKMMNDERKAEAWIKISLKLKEAAEKDEDGDTQLMILCAKAKGNVVNYMLEYVYALVELLKTVPCALSAVNNQKHSALYLAALHSDYPNRAVVVRYIAETLVELGETIDHINGDGNSMLHDLCRQGDQRYDVLVELLSLKTQNGKPCFDLNKYNMEGKTPLHLAAASHGTNGVSCLKTVRLLVAEGANASLPEGSRSNTALHVAIEHSSDPGLVQALLSGPGQNDRTCNMLNQNKDSPLHSAASRNDLPIEQQARVIEMLMDPRHSTAKNTNASGKYPIQLVAEERRQRIRYVYETRKGSVGLLM